MRENGQIVVIVAHRPSAIFAANKILSLRNGRAEMFGPKKQVLAALFPRHGQPHKPHPVEGVTQDEASRPARAKAQHDNAKPGSVTPMYAPRGEAAPAGTRAETSDRLMDRLASGAAGVATAGPAPA
jgi:hypothetical protein